MLLFYSSSPDAVVPSSTKLSFSLPVEKTNCKTLLPYADELRDAIPCSFGRVYVDLPELRDSPHLLRLTVSGDRPMQNATHIYLSHPRKSKETQKVKSGNRLYYETDLYLAPLLILIKDCSTLTFTISAYNSSPDSPEDARVPITESVTDVRIVVALESF